MDNDILANAIRTLYFEATGLYSIDKVIIEYFINIIKEVK